ncbi:secreted RxLR effector protein 161-like [Arachis duranensis]|uniref:Secreted RxLR effector protein 161-like n=1 Tax=Arachis duranensis TaxID=130453 RepID=A0A6P4DBF9_ARADU|nr:secreted RxLR effector protein 161-like [Arachis duranensis]
MVGCAPGHTPLPSTIKITTLGCSSFCDLQLYRSIIGSLQYLTIITSEICYSVNKLSQFIQAPLESHWKLVKRVLRYLSGTSSYGLHLKRETSLGITAYSDSDWARDPDDRKSTNGYCIFLGTNLISWTSKKQTVVARSSTEAEYRSMAEAVAELTWIKTMMRELLHPLPEAPML